MYRHEQVVDEGGDQGRGKPLIFRLLGPSHHGCHEAGYVLCFGWQVDDRVTTHPRITKFIFEMNTPQLAAVGMVTKPA